MRFYTIGGSLFGPFCVSHKKKKVTTAVEYTAVTAYSHWVAHNTTNEMASFFFSP